MAPLLLRVVAYVGALACLVSADTRVRVFGDRYWHPQYPNEFVRTYVDMPKDHDGDTLPTAVGVQITPGFVRTADELPVNMMASIPFGPATPFNLTSFENHVLHFPQVGRNPFKFNSWTYNFFGHLPIGVYDHQHFDVRFFFPTPEYWWDEVFSVYNWGPCLGASAEVFYNATLPVPVDCWPGGANSTVDNDQGNFVYGQAMHLYNKAEPQWSNEAFNDVQSVVWGMYGGEISFLEAMISRDDAASGELNKCISIKDIIPKRFNTERAVPTELCWLSGPTSFKVELRKFVMAPGGCLDLRNGPMTGYFPAAVFARAQKHGYYTDPSCRVAEPQ